MRDIRRTVRMGMWVAVAFGLVGMGIAFAGEALLRVSGQDPAIAALAGDFLAVIAFAMIPMILGGVFRTFVAALGKPGYATAITLLALGTNALGNWILVFGNLGAPELGLIGSALSSVITALAMLGAYLLVITRDRTLRRYRIFGRWWRPEWTRLREIMIIGTPIAMTVLAEAGLFSGAALLMGRFGETELAAHTLALNLAALASRSLSARRRRPRSASGSTMVQATAWQRGAPGGWRLPSAPVHGHHRAGDDAGATQLLRIYIDPAPRPMRPWSALRSNI